MENAKKMVVACHPSQSGSAHVPLAEAGQPPAWALGHGRDREGQYVLAPNPWGPPVRVAFPIEVKAGVLPLWSLDLPKHGDGYWIGALTLGLDSVGLLAGLTVNGVRRQVFRHIEPGFFMMGAPESELDSLAAESPRHGVVISQGFWMADTTCTQGMWQAVMGQNPSHFHGSNKGGPEHPVECVSWNMVHAFVQKLQDVLPCCRVTLPTEAEWEYACRAGTDTPFSFGETVTVAQVNYDGNNPYADGARGERRGQTVPVKELPANPWGLHQMHGNVWEWCAGGMRAYSAGQVVDPGLVEALDPLLDCCEECVLRGGGWIFGAREARSASRTGREPGSQGRSTGFRLVLRTLPK